VQRAQKIGGREPVYFVPVGFIPGSAGIAGEHAGQLPRDPVASLNNDVSVRVELGGFLKQLQCLGNKPFGRDLTAIAGQPRLLSGLAQFVDSVGLWLGSVVLPKFGPGVRPFTVGLQGA